MKPRDLQKARRRVALAPKPSPVRKPLVERVHPALVDLVKERDLQGVEVRAWTLKGGEIR